MLVQGEAIPKAEWVKLNAGTLHPYQIVVRDGSGSMYGIGADFAINIANSLALLFAEQLTGAYKDSFITFSCFP